MGYMVMQLTSSEEQFAEMAIAEQLELILEQIATPINKLSVNYYKTFLESVDKEYIDDKKKAKAMKYDGSLQILEAINNKFQNKIALNVTKDDLIIPITDVLYRFFIRNSYSNIETFIAQFLLNSTNRKTIVEYLKDTKTTSYTKEAYGCKQNYILANNMPKIIELIKGTEITFEDFLKYTAKSMDCPGHITRLDTYIKDGFITIEDSIIGCMLGHLIDSSFEGALYNSLISMIHIKIIGPMIGTIPLFPVMSNETGIPVNSEGLFVLTRREVL